MPALFPSMVAPDAFKVGDAVRKFITPLNTSPCGVVTHIIPATYKVWVQWPTEHTQESPETLIKVNPFFWGMPSSVMDHGYDSYEKTRSEKEHGALQKAKSPFKMFRITAADKRIIRIAHVFATEVVGKLVGDICKCQDVGFSDVQAYNRIYDKYGYVCSDHIIRFSIDKVYANSKNAQTSEK
jgi:hypothetical protein